MMPPTLSAPVSSSARTAVRRYPGGSRQCPSTRATTECRDALIAALSALGICPEGLGTTVMRESPAAIRSAISLVRSRDGPTARASSSSPG